MPIISMFYGIIIRMYTEPGKKHQKVFRIDPLR